MKKSNSRNAIVLATLVALAAASVQPQTRTVNVLNRSGKKIAVDWVSPEGKTVTISGDVADGSKTVLNSFVNHTFAIREPSQDPTTCRSPTNDGGGSCGAMGLITVSSQEDQVVLVKRGFEVSYEAPDSPSRQPSTQVGNMKACEDIAMQQLKDGVNRMEVFEELSECLEEEAADLIKDKNEEIVFERDIRLALSHELENHTCADVNKETSEPKEIRSWISTNGEAREVYVLHNHPSSQIHAIKNFISEEECDAITQKAEPRLSRGTVANGVGGSKLSETRKAWQASLKWNRTHTEDPISRVMHRIYEYANDAVGYNLSTIGQEGLMSIQYFGVGTNSTEPPDQYRPHCDGECDGLPHKTGGRVATMVMYCNVPDVGGSTNFQNANVYVKPEVGTAALFSYMDPVTKNTELGYTMHSGCPVIEGTKRIAVHWLREGVDKENPWDSFNTLTIRKGKEEEDC